MSGIGEMASRMSTRKPLGLLGLSGHIAVEKDETPSAGAKPCGHGPDSDYRRCSPCHRILGEAEGHWCQRCSGLATRLCRPCQTPDLR